MKLRYYAAVVTGVLTGMLAFGYAWMFTEMDALVVTIFTVLAALYGWIGVMAATEQKPERKELPGPPPIYTLKDGKWEVLG